MEIGRTRYRERRKKRKGMLFNILFVIVLIMLIYFTIKLFVKNDVIEEANGDELIEEEQLHQHDDVPMNDEMSSDHDESEDEKVKTPLEVDEHDDEQAVDGQWEPIGTTQLEPFAADFTRDSVNWQEMERALKYAIGTEEKITIWWLGNGGDHLSAEGVVSTPQHASTPYRVRLEWVTEKGWKPVSVEQLENNPYREEDREEEDET